MHPFKLRQPCQLKETRSVELKEVTGPNSIRPIVEIADEYAVAFLNSEGGSVYWGIRDGDKVVVGVTLSDADQDRIQRDVYSKLSEIQPQIDPTRFRLHWHSIEGGAPNLFVVELEVPAGNSSKPYYTGRHECFVRVEGVKKRLSGQQLTDWILSRAGDSATSIQEEPLDPNLIAFAQRVRRIFSGHGLQPGHLARFFAIRKADFTISLADQKSDAAFLGWLNEAKLSWIADTFGIRRAWIDGEDGRIYEPIWYDKKPKAFHSVITQFGNVSVRNDLPEAWYLRFGQDKLWRKDGWNRVFVIMRFPIARLSNEVTVYRYVSDFEPYPWTRGRTAIQLRAWARLLFAQSFNIVAREVSHDVGQTIWSNSTFLHDIFESPAIATRCRDDWHPEDCTLYSHESAVAKADEFFDPMVEFLTAHGLAEAAGIGSKE